MLHTDIAQSRSCIGSTISDISSTVLYKWTGLLCVAWLPTETLDSITFFQMSCISRQALLQNHPHKSFRKKENYYWSQLIKSLYCIGMSAGSISQLCVPMLRASYKFYYLLPHIFKYKSSFSSALVFKIRGRTIIGTKEGRIASKISEPIELTAVLHRESQCSEHTGVKKYIWHMRAIAQSGTA